MFAFFTDEWEIFTLYLFADVSFISFFFFAEMELKPYLDNDFYIKESRDMITIVQSMLIAGNYQQFRLHKKLLEAQSLIMIFS